ncbi:CvpA family protein [Wenzhouxiangella sp. XN79A]|uniref:CvpA family protein n=1 Tax=Wenzhouxiangella sp. XN79A TaxID=2724193 RepID=UPI00144A9D31|nr:CvpA family protein [Wenzhouxiangella sp. XN79A]NKI35919.1 CvpA family protein [Wenzhouxiangella sp. XN79A]
MSVGMNGADLAILGILALSVLVSLFRGFIKEVFSILVWVAAAFAAFQAAPALAEGLAPHIDLPSARTIIAFVAVFVLVLVIGGLISYLIGQVVEKTGLSPTDRMFGGLFGLARGVVIVLLAVMLARITPFPNDPWWQDSRLIPRFERMADWTSGFLPESVQNLLDAGQQQMQSTDEFTVDTESRAEPI